MASEQKKIKHQRRSAVPPQYRRKRRWVKVVGIVSAVALLCGVLALLVLPKVLEDYAASQATQPTAPPPDQVIHLVAGGDVNITDKTVAAGMTAGGFDYTEVFKDVLPVLAGGDVSILNFEGVLSGNSYGTATKKAPTEMLDALASAGVDVLQTANSYSIYDSLRGLKATLQGVQAAGMTPLGTYATNADFNESGGYIIWDINGVKVAMMAFTKGMVNVVGLPTGLPAGSENCVNLLYEDYNSTYQKVNKEGITQIVRNAAAHDPDVMVALVHWGSEHNDQISKYQKQICTILQNEGVDAILGTHPHYVQKMEYDPETGAFIAYSLGDFFGDGDVAGTGYSVLLDLEITKSGATGEAKITNFSYVPIYTEQREDGSMRVLRIKEAIIGYENQYLDRVSEETYLAMKAALTRIESRIKG